MYQSSQEGASRIMQRFAAGKQEQLGNRADLYLADYRVLPENRKQAEVLIKFSPNLTAPKKEDLREFFTRRINTQSVEAKVNPLIHTATVYPKECAIILVAERVPTKRKISDTSEMKPIRPGQVYQDIRTSEVFNVQEQNGEKILFQDIEDDLDGILSARKQVVVATTGGMLNQITRTAGRAQLENGDIASFFYKGKKCKGVVNRVVVDGHNDVIYMDYNGAEIPVPYSDVQVIQHNSNNLDKERDYYNRAYGDPGYAEKLTQQ